MGKPGVLTQSQARMPLDYFKRKWMALASISPQDKAARYKQQTLVANFKAHFSHYSRSPDLVDSFMAWLRSVRIHDSELWALYASYLHTHSYLQQHSCPKWLCSKQCPGTWRRYWRSG